MGEITKPHSVIGDLAPNPENPRIISESQLRALKKSIAEFGPLDGFIFNTKTHSLVGGHQRQRVLPKDAKIAITKRHEKPTDTGTTAEGYIEHRGEKFPYREVSWSKTKERSANIAANKHGGDFELKGLADWLLDLDANNIDMELTGFSEKELEDICAPFRNMPEQEDDHIPEVPKKPKSKQGDLYILGEHRVLCGNCTVKANVDRLMDGEKADMVFTDPPYGMNLDTDYSKIKGLTKSKLNKNYAGKKYNAVIGDDKPYDPSNLLKTFAATQEVFMCGGDYYHHRLPNCGNFLVWDKSSNDADAMIGSAFELIWSKQKHKKEIARIYYRGAFGQGKDDKRIHPTQKPIKLMEWFFERWGKKTKLVWDGYLGSGSTLIACEKTGRRCYGMEIDPHYVDVIVKRWEDYTGNKAKLAK